MPCAAVWGLPVWNRSLDLSWWSRVRFACVPDWILPACASWTTIWKSWSCSGRSRGCRNAAGNLL